jgi:hypothetical protein
MDQITNQNYPDKAFDNVKFHAFAFKFNTSTHLQHSFFFFLKKKMDFRILCVSSAQLLVSPMLQIKNSRSCEDLYKTEAPNIDMLKPRELGQWSRLLMACTAHLLVIS